MLKKKKENKNYIKEYNLKGTQIEYLENHPSILKLLIERSESKSLDIFKSNPYASISEGGFNWNLTKEGDIFWNEILILKNTDIFYEIYPK